MTEMTVYRDGHIQIWPETEMARDRDGRLQIWPETMMTEDRDGQRQGDNLVFHTSSLLVIQASPGGANIAVHYCLLTALLGISSSVCGEQRRLTLVHRGGGEGRRHSASG